MQKGWGVCSFLLLALFGSLGVAEAKSIKELYPLVLPSVVRIESMNLFGVAEKIGSGFLIEDGCTVVTNSHVVEGYGLFHIGLGAGRWVTR